MSPPQTRSESRLLFAMRVASVDRTSVDWINIDARLAALKGKERSSTVKKIDALKQRLINAQEARERGAKIKTTIKKKDAMLLKLQGITKVSVLRAAAYIDKPYGNREREFRRRVLEYDAIDWELVKRTTFGDPISDSEEPAGGCDLK